MFHVHDDRSPTKDTLQRVPDFGYYEFRLVMCVLWQTILKLLHGEYGGHFVFDNTTEQRAMDLSVVQNLDWRWLCLYDSRVGVVKTSSWNAYRVWSSFCWEQHDRAMTTLRVWSSFCRGRHDTNNPQIESVSCSWKLFDLSLGNIWLSFVWFFHMEASVEGWWWYLTRGQKGWVRIPRGAAVFNTYM